MKSKPGEIPKLPYMRAFDLVAKDPDLTSAEKLVMFSICRYWPNPSIQSNPTIAKSVGFKERYVQKIIAQLVGKKKIYRGYAHTIKNGKPHTCRAIVPTHFPRCEKSKVDWIKDGHMATPRDGQTATPPTAIRCFSGRPNGHPPYGHTVLFGTAKWPPY